VALPGDFLHAGVADARLRVSMVLEIVQDALAIFFECALCVGIFASQRSEWFPRRDALHLRAQEFF
jgi:hypothetical protein